MLFSINITPTSGIMTCIVLIKPLMLRCGEGHFKEKLHFYYMTKISKTLAPQFMTEKLLLNTNQPQPILPHPVLESREGGGLILQFELSFPCSFFSSKTSLVHVVLKKEFNIMNCWPTCNETRTIWLSEISCNHRVTVVVMNVLQFDAQWLMKN